MWEGWIITRKSERHFLQSIGVCVIGAEMYPTGARFHTDAWHLDVVMGEEAFFQLEPWWNCGFIWSLTWHPSVQKGV